MSCVGIVVAMFGDAPFGTVRVKSYGVMSRLGRVAWSGMLCGMGPVVSSFVLCR